MFGVSLYSSWSDIEFSELCPSKLRNQRQEVNPAAAGMESLYQKEPWLYLTLFDIIARSAPLIWQSCAEAPQVYDILVQSANVFEARSLWMIPLILFIDPSRISPNNDHVKNFLCHNRKNIWRLLSRFASCCCLGGIVHKARASKNVGASRKNVTLVVALRARMSNQWDVYSRMSSK